MLILSKSNASIEQAKQWAKNCNATKTFIDLASVYYKICDKYGVNFAVAYCQFAKESGYGKFNGTVPVSFHNPCGLKRPEGGSDTDKYAHVQFKNWEDGVYAHIEHLALYSAAKGFPLKNPHDPKHKNYIYGLSKTVEGLTGNWCNEKNYSSRIIEMVQELENTKVEEIKLNTNEKLVQENKQLKDENNLLKNQIKIVSDELQEKIKELNNKDNIINEIKKLIR